MSSRPLVGVVIPVWNGERYLSEAIESVLGQTHDAVDIVVVDDGSQDSSADIAGRYAPDVRVVRCPHRGSAAARNTGTEAVRGDFVALLDHDDLWPARKLEIQLAAFGSPEPPDIVFGHVREFISPEIPARAARRLRCTPEPRPAKLSGTMLATRAAVDRVGPTSTEWISADFLAWLLAARRLGLREIMLPDHVLSRRVHELNVKNHGSELPRSEYLRILKAALDQNRAGSQPGG
jgi:glycosyltransferase involved in cell wall biosynthesis